jgi:transposase
MIANQIAAYAKRFPKPVRCRHVSQIKGREFKCSKCGLIYNRDLNACVNIAHALTRGMGWGEPQTSR